MFPAARDGVRVVSEREALLAMRRGRGGDAPPARVPRAGAAARRRGGPDVGALGPPTAAPRAGGAFDAARRRRGRRPRGDRRGRGRRRHRGRLRRPRGSHERHGRRRRRRAAARRRRHHRRGRQAGQVSPRAVVPMFDGRVRTDARTAAAQRVRDDRVGARGRVVVGGGGRGAQAGWRGRVPIRELRQSQLCAQLRAAVRRTRVHRGGDGEGRSRRGGAHDTVRGREIGKARATGAAAEELRVRLRVRAMRRRGGLATRVATGRHWKWAPLSRLLQLPTVQLSNVLEQQKLLAVRSACARQRLKARWRRPATTTRCASWTSSTGRTGTRSPWTTAPSSPLGTSWTNSSTSPACSRRTKSCSPRARCSRRTSRSPRRSSPGADALRSC
mmetsp:Transcript_8559/g.34578  ORF Transcript_8559/g.34578 Transcript_8559/m.34578 type:complete len:387 (+) Transcript_8559:198-1358(+)